VRFAQLMCVVGLRRRRVNGWPDRNKIRNGRVGRQIISG